jgi:hypothetical protein
MFKAGENSPIYKQIAHLVSDYKKRDDELVQQFGVSFISLYNMIGFEYQQKIE